MISQRKTVLILLTGVIAIAILFFGLLIYSLFSSSNQSEAPIPTPTPVPYQRDASGKFIFTSLAKAVVGVTTAKDVEEKQTVISKSISGDITTYEVASATPGETDEIKTQNGIVIFESNNLFNKVAGYPPKLEVYQNEFGEPEKVLKSVSPLGKHISAYIYARQGFTLFVNPNTKTVYEIQRYIPMDLQTYEKQFPEFLQPAPEYPKEYFR